MRQVGVGRKSLVASAPMVWTFLALLSLVEYSTPDLPALTRLPRRVILLVHSRLLSPHSNEPMPQFKTEAYAQFFGDDLARSIRSDAQGADITHLAYVQLQDLYELQAGINGLSKVLNKSQAHVGLTPQQFQGRQAVITAARSVLVAERNKLLERAYNQWTSAREQTSP